MLSINAQQKSEREKRENQFARHPMQPSTTVDGLSKASSLHKFNHNCNHSNRCSWDRIPFHCSIHFWWNKCVRFWTYSIPNSIGSGHYLRRLVTLIANFDSKVIFFNCHGLPLLLRTMRCLRAKEEDQKSYLRANEHFFFSPFYSVRMRRFCRSV